MIVYNTTTIPDILNKKDNNIKFEIVKCCLI